MRSLPSGCVFCRHKNQPSLIWLTQPQMFSRYIPQPEKHIGPNGRFSFKMHTCGSRTGDLFVLDLVPSQICLMIQYLFDGSVCPGSVFECFQQSVFQGQISLILNIFSQSGMLRERMRERGRERDKEWSKKQVQCSNWNIEMTLP